MMIGIAGTYYVGTPIVMMRVPHSKSILFICERLPVQFPLVFAASRQ